MAHFYLEGHHTNEPHEDEQFAKRFGEVMIDTYTAMLQQVLAAATDPTPAERREQLAYPTLYLFQVLTLDRGKTSGLLVHNQNDAGIMGSLPSHVDRSLLASWVAHVPPIQAPLVRALVQALPDSHPSPVTAEVKLALAATVRGHYRRHPEALALQARGDVLPPTVQNHRG